MNRELNISSEQYGLLSGFFLGLLSIRVPSNLILHRTGARTWIARIWLHGVSSRSQPASFKYVTQLYLARFVLGVAERLLSGNPLYLSAGSASREQAQAVVCF